MRTNSFISCFISEKGNLSIAFTGEDGEDLVAFGAVGADGKSLLAGVNLVKRESKKGTKYVCSARPVNVEYTVTNRREGLAEITGIADAPKDSESLAIVQALLA